MCVFGLWAVTGSGFDVRGLSTTTQQATAANSGSHRAKPFPTFKSSLLLVGRILAWPLNRTDDDGSYRIWIIRQGTSVPDSLGACKFDSISGGRATSRELFFPKEA